jgi:hypothetical protein
MVDIDKFIFGHERGFIVVKTMIQQVVEQVRLRIVRLVPYFQLLDQMMKEPE